MAINLELKAALADHEIIKHSLKTINATFEGSLDQKDIYYNVPKGLLKLRIENGKSSLIRYYRDEKNPERWSNYFVVYLEGKETEELFESLYEIETTVIKKRELFLYKDTRIHLDKVTNLGHFIELETVVHDSKDRAKILFDEMTTLLQLDLTKQIRSSYKDLILAK